MTNANRRHPWLAAFFTFGASMSALTVILLLRPGTRLDSLWRLNVAAQTAFRSLGSLAIIVMLVVGIACALAAVGLARGRRWGAWLALLILCLNIIGDLFNALVRHDYRTLIGLPIAGLMIFSLLRCEAAVRSSQK